MMSENGHLSFAPDSTLGSLISKVIILDKLTLIYLKEVLRIKILFA